MKFYFLSLLLLLLVTGCKIDHPIGDAQKIHYGDTTIAIQTKYVFVLVIDGPRWSETFGDASYTNVKHQAKKLVPEGVFFENFRNLGPTYTISGHTAICTGHYEKMNNSGHDIPSHPSIFQYFLKQKHLDKRKAWILTSKGKLQVLSHTSDKYWKRTYQPSSYSGTLGSGQGYPSDKNMWPIFKNIIDEQHPHLTLINLLDPDAWAHQNNWDRYIQGIQQADKFALELWNMIQKDPFYKNKTTLFITNDHGRHLDGVRDGFVSHGDQCEGCQHIQLIALGPDFQKGTKVSTQYDLLDLTATIAAMLDITMPTDGVVIQELFQKSSKP